MRTNPHDAAAWGRHQCTTKDPRVEIGENSMDATPLSTPSSPKQMDRQPPPKGSRHRIEP